MVTTGLLTALMCFAAAQTPAVQPPGASSATNVRNLARAASRKQAASKPSPVPEPQSAPAPLTPEQMPPVPPQVTFNNGLLTIVATNSTLADILHAVSVRTGASVDAPAQLTGERVAARIGPGTPREVLSDLLRGPRFDYILLGSDDGNPNAVRSIILTPNRSSPSASPAVAQVQPRPRPAPPAQEEEDDAEDQPEPAPPQPANQFPSRRPFPQQPPGQIGRQPGGSGEGGPPPQVKTQEQLLEDLRNLQQQNPPQR